MFYKLPLMIISMLQEWLHLLVVSRVEEIENPNGNIIKDKSNKKVIVDWKTGKLYQEDLEDKMFKYGGAKDQQVILVYLDLGWVISHLNGKYEMLVDWSKDFVLPHLRQETFPSSIQPLLL